MVGTRIGLLAALSQQQCIHMMIVGKSVLIAELCREINGLIRRTARYVLRTGMLVHIVLGQWSNTVASESIVPRGFIHCIVVVDRSDVRSSVVYGELCTEWQSFQYFIQIEVDSRIKLETTWSSFLITGRIHGSKRISHVQLRTSQ